VCCIEPNRCCSYMLLANNDKKATPSISQRFQKHALVESNRCTYKPTANSTTTAGMMTKFRHLADAISNAVVRVPFTEATTRTVPSMSTTEEESMSMRCESGQVRFADWDWELNIRTPHLQSTRKPSERFRTGNLMHKSWNSFPS
jgi:hypothetical protein